MRGLGFLTVALVAGWACNPTPAPAPPRIQAASASTPEAPSTDAPLLSLPGPCAVTEQVTAELSSRGPAPREAWRMHSEAVLEGGIAAGDDAVVVFTESGVALYAGARPRWTRKLAVRALDGTVIGAEGCIPAATEENAVHCLEPSSGEDRFAVGAPPDSRVTNAVAFEKGIVAITRSGLVTYLNPTECSADPGSCWSKTQTHQSIDDPLRLAFLPSQRLALVGMGEVGVIDSHGLPQSQPFPSGSGYFEGVVAGPNGTVVSGSSEGELRQWDPSKCPHDATAKGPEACTQWTHTLSDAGIGRLARAQLDAVVFQDKGEIRGWTPNGCWLVPLQSWAFLSLPELVVALVQGPTPETGFLIGLDPASGSTLWRAPLKLRPNRGLGWVNASIVRTRSWIVVRAPYDLIAFEYPPA